MQTYHAAHGDSAQHLLHTCRSGQNALLRLAIGGFADLIALAFFVEYIFFFGEHQFKKRGKGALHSIKALQLCADKGIDGRIASHIV